MPNVQKKERVVVAMSGGVDSSVCAWLLKKEGHEVIGVTLKTWTNDECRDEKSKGCCSLRDIDDARSVARKIGIPYYVMDLSGDFKEKVVDYFVEEYLAGRTPNPCIECNNWIKFGALSRKAGELGASYIATGHYARKAFSEEQRRFFIREGRDLSKDQSYVLFGLNQDQLSQILLPVGDLEKREVRHMAADLGLRVSDKPDSQEICFVKKDYADFVEKYSPEKLPGRGVIMNRQGQAVGTHDGSHLFTIGQRKRIRITNSTPYFVTDIHAVRNEVTIGSENELYTDEMSIHRVNWQMAPRLGRISVKIRSRHQKADANIVSIRGEFVQVRFADPQKAVTPGQAAVFYEGDAVLGGGWIMKAFVAKEMLASAAD